MTTRIKYTALLPTILFASLASFTRPASLLASSFEEVNIAILDFEGAGLQTNEIVMASDKFRTSFIEASKYRISESPALPDTLKMQGLEQTDTSISNSNVMSSGRRLGVSYICAGRFSQANGITAISARIIDVKTGEILLAKNSEFKSKFSKFISTDIPLFARDFNVSLEKSIKDFAEQHKKGILFIESTPENGLISVDGVETGKSTPVTFHEIDVGKHTILINSGKLAGTTEVSVTAGKLEKCMVSLTPGFGSLRIQSSTPGAALVISGKGGYHTPVQIDSLEVGVYIIECTHNDYYPYATTVSVSALQTTDLSIEMKPLSYLLFENLIPTATVWIDGRLVDMQGVNLLAVPPGTHDVQIQRAGFRDGFFDVVTTKGDTTYLKIDYTPLPATLTVSTVPPRAGIILNGHFKGRTPSIFHNMQPDTYSLMLTDKIHKPINRQFYLASGSTLAIQDTFKQLSGEYLEWKHRQYKLHYYDMILAGSGRTMMKQDAPGFLFLGAGLASDLIFGYSTYKYYSHNQKSIHAKSVSELDLYEKRETEDFIWAVSSCTTSLLLRLFSSLLTINMEF